MERPKVGIDFWADVIFVDDTDFKTNKDGVVWGDVSVYYSKKGDTVLTKLTMSSDLWREIGHADGQQFYQVKFVASIMDTLGAFRYIITTSGGIFYPGKFFIRSKSEEEIITERTAIKTEVDTHPTVGEIDIQLISTHGSGNWTTGGTGSGSVTFTYITYENDMVTPIPNTIVEVYTNIAMTPATLIANSTSDAFGKVTFYLNPGTYYFKRIKAGYNFTNPDTEVIT